MLLENSEYYFIQPRWRAVRTRQFRVNDYEYEHAVLLYAGTQL